MGAVHATMNVSIDGCCDHTQVLADDEFHARMADLFGHARALLFGRATYELLRGYWPAVAASGAGSAGEMRLAHVLDQLPKYVVSSRPLAPGWNASRIDATAAAVRAVRKAVDGTVLLVASPTLARSMLRWRLVEEYHVAVSPMVAGHGPYFLAGLEHTVTPSLLDIDRLASGVVICRYGIRNDDAA